MAYKYITNCDLKSQFKPLSGQPICINTLFTDDYILFITMHVSCLSVIHTPNANMADLSVGLGLVA